MGKTVDFTSATDAQREQAVRQAEEVPHPEEVAEQERDSARRVALEQLAPPLSDLYGPVQLERDSARELVSLATLPPWPGGPAAGHGWGHALNAQLGGGVCPPYVLAVGASSAGAGKTAWVHQLADGLALRTAHLAGLSPGAAPGPLTPVLFLSEMGTDALAWRTLARWTGRSASDFRQGKSHPEPSAVLSAAREALADLAHARTFQRYWQGRETGPELVAKLADLVGAWDAVLRAEHPSREVWPVLVVDPLQRFAGYGSAGEVEAVNALVTALAEQARKSRWVVLLTSDTNKASATGNASAEKPRANVLEEGAAALRGTYVLTHMADAVLYLRREEESETVAAHLVKNRWGKVAKPDGSDSARYRWNGAAMRFETVAAARTV